MKAIAIKKATDSFFRGANFDKKTESARQIIIDINIKITAEGTNRTRSKPGSL